MNIFVWISLFIATHTLLFLLDTTPIQMHPFYFIPVMMIPKFIVIIIVLSLLFGGVFTLGLFIGAILFSFSLNFLGIKQNPIPNDYWNRNRVIVISPHIVANIISLVAGLLIAGTFPWNTQTIIAITSPLLIISITIYIAIKARFSII